jgi:hypothetical protein
MHDLSYLFIKYPGLNSYEEEGKERGDSADAVRPADCSTLEGNTEAFPSLNSAALALYHIQPPPRGGDLI